MALFIFDFDFTLVNGHTHNTILDKILEEKRARGKSDLETDQELQWELIKAFPPIHPEKFIATLKKILEAGHQVAIASFSSYGSHIIPRYLREVMHVPEDLISKIFITSWLPANPNTANKNEHIKQAIEHFDYKTEHPASIALIDDSPKNLSDALSLNYSIFEAFKNGSHFENIDYFLAALKDYEFFCYLQNDDPHGLNYTKSVPQRSAGFNIDESDDDQPGLKPKS